jgi:hypothetical protein
MRRTGAIVAAVVVTAVLGGCDLLKKNNGDCTAQPGLTTGYSQVCSAPPPSQFDQLGK